MLLLSEHNCDAVRDAKRFRDKSDDGLDTLCRNIWDRRNRGDDYSGALTCILAAAGIQNPYGRKLKSSVIPVVENSEEQEEEEHMDCDYERSYTFHEERRDNVGCSRERDPLHVSGCDVDVDLQFVAALGCMKENGNAYALEDEKSGSRLLCVYEGESSLEEVCGYELGRKTRSGVEPVEKQEKNANDVIGEESEEEDFFGRKNVARLNYGICDVSNNDGNNQVTTKLVELADDVSAQPNRKYNVQRNRHLKERVEEKNATSGDSPSNRNRKKRVEGKSATSGDSLSNRHWKKRVEEKSATSGDSQSNRNGKKRVKKKNVAAGDNDAYKKAGTRKSNGHLLPRSSPRLHPVTEVLHTIHDIDRQGEVDKVQNVMKSNKLFKGKGVVLGRDEPVRRMMIKRSREEQSESDREARDKEERVLRRPTETKKVVKLVSGGKGRLVQLDNERVHKKRDLVEKIHVERVENGRLYNGANIDHRSNKQDKVVIKENTFQMSSKKGYLKHMEMQGRAAILKKGNPSSSIPLKKRLERVDHKKVKVDRQRKSKKVIAEENLIQRGWKGYKNTRKNDREKHSDEDSGDVEILDPVAVINEGNRSCFVHARRDRNEADFRERVLKVIKAPYDHDEYRRLNDEFKPYSKQHGGVQRRLTKYRAKPVKRLGVLRGFFYWVKHVVHDNTLKPWKDRECLDAEPGST